MVREFGYTRQEIERHTKTGRSYWAEPLRFNGEFVGVLFLFSTEAQVFPRAADGRRFQSIAGNVAGILKAASII
jgi:GAF domain-containing protein